MQVPSPPPPPPLGNSSGAGPSQLGATQTTDASSPSIKKTPMTKVSIIKHLSPRSIVQVFLTVLALGTGIVAFVFAIVFRDYLINQLEANYKGPLKSEILPCLRSTLDVCGNDKYFQCWDKCCPPGYVCERSPTVGLYCQDGANACGGSEMTKFTWCRDFADIPMMCKSTVCQDKEMVHDMTLPAFFLAGIGVQMDVIDSVIFFAAPDSVQCKAGVNLMSSLVKWLAFGVVLGAGTLDFMSDLYDNQCFNGEGMTAVQTTGELFYSFVVMEIISALLSLMLAPISAYYGGKLIGVPYVK